MDSRSPQKEDRRGALSSTPRETGAKVLSIPPVLRRAHTPFEVQVAYSIFSGAEEDKAAAQGSAGGLANLGPLHRRGQGVAWNFMNASFLSSRATHRGSGAVPRDGGVAAADLTPEHLAAAQNLSLGCAGAGIPCALREGRQSDPDAAPTPPKGCSKGGEKRWELDLQFPAVFSCSLRGGRRSRGVEVVAERNPIGGGRVGPFFGWIAPTPQRE